MILWDYDETTRLTQTAAFAKQFGYTQPENILGSQLLCYGNIWAMAPASALARGWNYFSGNKPGQQQSEYGGMSGVLDPARSGMWPGEAVELHRLRAATSRLTLHYAPQSGSKSASISTCVLQEELSDVGN